MLRRHFIPNGLIQRCHAGIDEVVVPVQVNDKVVALLYAGAGIIEDPNFSYQRSRQMAPDLPQPQSAIWIAEPTQLLLELLRQLGARLERWLQIVGIDSSATTMDRRSKILHFISNHAQHSISLADLAKRLGLSTDRTSHAVRDEFGVIYLSLVKQYQLERAASLLMHSDMAISDIALRSGFGDMSTFSMQIP